MAYINAQRHNLSPGLACSKQLESSGKRAMGAQCGLRRLRISGSVEGGHGDAGANLLGSGMQHMQPKEPGAAAQQGLWGMAGTAELHRLEKLRMQIMQTCLAASQQQPRQQGAHRQPSSTVWDCWDLAARAAAAQAHAGACCTQKLAVFSC